MLRRHYPEHGTSKTRSHESWASAEIGSHRWIRAGDLDRDLEDIPVQ
jgi:hypothetical protein